MEERRESERMSGFSFRMKNHIFRVVDFFFDTYVDMRIKNFGIKEMNVIDYGCGREARSVNPIDPELVIAWMSWVGECGTNQILIRKVIESKFFYENLPQ